MRLPANPGIKYWAGSELVEGNEWACAFGPIPPKWFDKLTMSGMGRPLPLE